MTEQIARTKFHKYRLLIPAVCALAHWLLPLFQNFLWDLSRLFGGQLALLLRADSLSVGGNVYKERNAMIMNGESLRTLKFLIMIAEDDWIGTGVRLLIGYPTAHDQVIKGQL